MGREPRLEDEPDSPVALALWLGVEPACGCQLGDCRCPEVDDEVLAIPGYVYDKLGIERQSVSP